MSKLQWKLLTKKRESVTKGVPPGKEAPAWVTNSVTLICGQRDAVVVDTFLCAQQSKKLVDRVVDASTSTALELYEEMVSLRPDRLNPGWLWAAARASKPS